MKDLMKKIMAKGGIPENADMKAQAKLKVLKHLKDMASGMMGQDVQKGMAPPVAAPPELSPAAPAPQAFAKGGMVKSIENWAKRSNSDPEAEKSDAKAFPKQANDGSADSEGIDDHDEDTEASVAEDNSMDNEEDAEDYNQEHTQESLDAEIARLHEMKRRIKRD